jgi:hypothetical protein
MKTSQSIMNDQHRANDSEWYCLEARTCGDKSDVVAYSCILELRDRIQALEATQHAHVDLSHLSDAERERMLKSLAKCSEALEAAAQQAHADASHVIDPEKEKTAQELAQSAGFAPKWPRNWWPRWSDFERCAASTEASKDAKPADSSPQPNHPEIPDSSLKERIKSRLIAAVGSTWEETSASVLVEVAAWLDTVPMFRAAVLLRVEAMR